MPPTLLCIDDEENGLKMRKWVLEAEGFQVLTALDGMTGIDLFKARAIDLVILDYNMPEMDGIAVARTLKKLNSAVPIIMLSAHAVPSTANEHIDASITKGESPAVLLSRAASLLHIRKHPHKELEGRYVAFVDEQRFYLDVTDGVCELLGYSRSELLGMRIDDVTAPSIHPKTPRLFQQYLADGLQQGDYVLRHRDGKEIPIDYIARVFPDGCMVARWKPKQGKRKALAS